MDIGAISPLILQQAFPGMSEEEAREMIASGSIRKFENGSVVCKEDALERTFYLLLDGEVEVTKLINDQEARFLKHLKPGDFFGEMAIIHDAPRAATITAITPITTLEINKDAFAGWLKRSSSMSMAMLREVSRRLRENDEMAIEDFRQKAKDLAAAYQQLADLDAARSAFLSTVAHELRTPLMAANGFVQIIQMGNLTGEALQSALDTVKRHLQDITSLINNILFLQEMDLIFPEFQPIDLGKLVASAVEQQRSAAARNRVGLKMEIAPELALIRGDAKSLERAIAAVLDNAVKFSPDGGDVLIEVAFGPREAWIQVTDHGVGIPADVLPHIFERFYHTDQIGKYLFRGIGLGLSIARQVIEQHHGRIEVQSEVGRGSVFTIFLPI